MSENLEIAPFPFWKSKKLIKGVIPSGKCPRFSQEVKLSDDTSIPSLPSPETPSEPSPPPSEPSSPRWRPARILFCATLVSLAISLGSVYLYDRFMAQKIVAVDLQGFLAAQKESYLRGEIDDDELKRRMDSLELFVTAIPKRYAVVLGEVVVRNVEVVKP